QPGGRRESAVRDIAEGGLEPRFQRKRFRTTGLKPRAASRPPSIRTPDKLEIGDYKLGFRTPRDSIPNSRPTRYCLWARVQYCTLPRSTLPRTVSPTGVCTLRGWSTFTPTPETDRSHNVPLH